MLHMREETIENFNKKFNTKHTLKKKKKKSPEKKLKLLTYYSRGLLKQ